MMKEIEISLREEHNEIRKMASLEYYVCIDEIQE